MAAARLRKSIHSREATCAKPVLKNIFILLISQSYANSYRKSKSIIFPEHKKVSN